MSRRLALAGVLAAALLALLLHQPGPDAVARPPRASSPPSVARATRPAATVLALPERNVFEYAMPTDQPVRQVTPAPESAPEPPTPREAVSTAPEPVRLVGLVNRGGRLRAALFILGEVVVLAPGEEAEGYRVLSVDPDRGVRLRGPDGTERALAPGETP